MTTLNSVTLNKQHIVDIDLQDETLTLEHNNLTFYYSIIGLEDIKFFILLNLFQQKLQERREIR